MYCTGYTFILIHYYLFYNYIEVTMFNNSYLRRYVDVEYKYEFLTNFWSY